MMDGLLTLCLTISGLSKAARRRCFSVLALYLCFPWLLIAALMIAITGTSFAQSIEWEKVDAAIGRRSRARS